MPNKEPTKECLEEIQAIICQVEACGASPDLTKAVIMLAGLKGTVSRAIQQALSAREEELVEKVKAMDSNSYNNLFDADEVIALIKG